MKYASAYLEYLIYFHAERDYFECHEVLEEHWKTTAQTEEDAYWVALIQIAVGLYHQRRGNLNGAKKMLSNALRLIKRDTTSIQDLGIEPQFLMQTLNDRLNQLETATDFEDINLPIHDSQLLTLCQNKCKELKLTWCKPSVLSNKQLIHKHTLRDRKEVINERAYQLEKRRQNTQNPHC
ncbi:DUF309 domain-containing protein [Alkalicoccobacillus plakortidis]|uniref:DUF309 domain-containing protein n=1 Tax=Alkalicoccobacillus plakortidis TaxID=444060 RepID=A0ABT0XEG4_9BACI|nr:DUF309 domain-containing protein [Alkalicoccobacillus plakortidis]MCM2674267.1 DUF309 domain-containing protein [Alkalicoccobacillus plakortidis]